MINLKNKKGQIALLVIVAIILLATTGVVFTLSKKTVSPTANNNDPSSEIRICARNSIQEALDKMIPQGGFINPENYKKYNNVKVSYLCQNGGYFEPCINQHPLFLSEEIKEVENYTGPIIEECFQSLKTEYEKNGYNVIIKPMTINISLGSNRISLNVDREMTFEKNQQTLRFDNLKVDMNSPLYDLSRVAMNIADQEAEYCYFEYVGHMLLYPRFDIKKFALSDNTKIYTIKDKYSNKEMNIATRGCAIPPGL